LLRPFIPLILRMRALRGKEIASRLDDRFGQPQLDQNIKGAIWIHAVSVGETVAAIGLAKALANAIPKARFLITTNTVSAAMAVEKESANGMALSHAFQPLDHPHFVDQFLQHTRPALAIFMESDFWPNLISKTAATAIPVIFASSQLSSAAFHRWTKQPAMAKAVFAAPHMVLAVNVAQAAQFQCLGTPAKIITVLGSLKLGTMTDANPTFCQKMKTAIGKRQILLAASTHDGEDASMIATANALGDNWLTIIAPRHPDRGNQIAAASGGAPQRSLRQFPSKDHRLYIMDSFGEMGSLFSLADLVILGGSFMPKGGHNPLEPAAFGLPIITGPHIFKNSAEFAGLRDVGVVFDVAETDDGPDATITGQKLAKLVNTIANDEPARRRIASAAKAYAVAANKRSHIAARKIVLGTMK
jgi:3-deoxy-D-manno-octulosonic-acid transferase